ncbi:MAG: hypothetical protein ACE5FS_06590 [Paracoccaceae bacterium]
MKRENGGMAAMAVVHAVCCGGILLVATGALGLGTVVAWLGSGPARVAGIAVLAVAVAAIAYRMSSRRKSRIPDTDRPGPVARHTRDDKTGDAAGRRAASPRSA